ncbi:DUF5107 domain-containing protein [Jonesiaceae bacterium BS-20]|uniref:DUF5107 domain-containing protein n=1 Tax=Jonesiaceae bacterium BS-20 TaxID=3120821 RepID=A0AAU7DUK6_9MICO
MKHISDLPHLPLSQVELPEPPADQQANIAAGGVACWSQDITIDTYEPAAPDRYPLFVNGRVYQGSSGQAYPIPFTDRIEQVKKPRVWKAIHLENEWVKLVLLPEIGGRIYTARDKVAGYDFFYRNNVIKPALVGIAGPWISGGVEFNWPQHHRPATFLPMDSQIQRDNDSDVTVWFNDLDQMQRMKGTHGVRLRGDSSLIEVAAKLHNRTDDLQTFLWWANVAAYSHENYQSFFPTDVAYVADHARHAITAFPKADRPYYGLDYPAQVTEENPNADRIDFYSNVLVPTSYMITDTDDDFFGGYDHDVNAGFIHWADKGIAPGKKMWTWGNGDVGHAWDRHLTDMDGPYVELMAGVFTDNQPDFTWINPGETKEFSQYWYPIRELGVVHQATRDVAVRLVLEGTTAKWFVGATRAISGATVALAKDGKVLATQGEDLTPGTTASGNIEVPAGTLEHELTLLVTDADGKVLLSWTPRVPIDAEKPWVATEPPMASEIESNDELVITGTHLVQYRHPTRMAEPYFDEALARDEKDSRAATAKGTLLLKRGDYEGAKAILEVGLSRMHRRNLQPREGETSYLLGSIAERTRDFTAAQKHYSKSTWDSQWFVASRFGLARVSARLGDNDLALERINETLKATTTFPNAYALKVVILRRLGREEEADATLALALEHEALDPIIRYLAGNLETVDPKTWLTVACDLEKFGELDQAAALARASADRPLTNFGNPAPMAHYLRAQWFEQVGRQDEANAARDAARASNLLYAFPYGLDEYDALIATLEADANDPVALGLLGSWLMNAKRTADAAEVLVKSTENGAVDPVVWRNAAVAVVNSAVEIGQDEDKAFAQAHGLYLKAIELAPNDARLIFEIDQLAGRRDESSAIRLARIEESACGYESRDDLTISYLNLLVDEGQTERALEIMTARSFQPFEGGEGSVIAVWDRAYNALAEAGVAAEGTDLEALAARLEESITLPINLGEGRHPLASTAGRWYWLGRVLKAAGNARAAQAFEKAAAGWNAKDVDLGLETHWSVKALEELGQSDSAAALTGKFNAFITELENSDPRVDYFATSHPDLLLFLTQPAEAQANQVAKLRATLG